MTLIKIERHIQKQKNKTVLLSIQIREVKLLHFRNLGSKEKIKGGRILGKYNICSFDFLGSILKL